MKGQAGPSLGLIDGQDDLVPFKATGNAGGDDPLDKVLGLQCPAHGRIQHGRYASRLHPARLAVPLFPLCRPVTPEKQLQNGLRVAVLGMKMRAH